MSAPAAAVPATKLRRTRPENAINVTVVALRPYNISTLNDKDSADAAGDVFFYVGDTLPQKYACKRTTHAMGCGDNSILVHDQVYTVSMLGRGTRVQLRPCMQQVPDVQPCGERSQRRDLALQLQGRTALQSLRLSKGNPVVRPRSRARALPLPAERGQLPI